MPPDYPRILQKSNHLQLEFEKKQHIFLSQF